jgi:hypothetical protein
MDSKEVRTIIEKAMELDVPLNLHSSEPPHLQAIARLAREYPRARIIMAHIGMKTLALSEGDEKKGVFGLSIEIDGREDLIFFAPAGCEFSYRDLKFKGPVAYLSS